MNEADFTSKIIDLLKVLNYGGPTGDREWNKSFLFSQCEERADLLVWILNELGINWNKTHFRNGKELHKRLLEDYSSLGFCDVSNDQLIDGSAPVILQYEFLNRVLTHLKWYLDGTSTSHDANLNNALRNVIHNTTLSNFIGTEEVNFLPPHLFTKYKQKLKKGTLQSTTKQLDTETETLKVLQSRNKSSPACYTFETSDEMNNLIKSAKEFNQLFKNQFEPWIRKEDLDLTIDNATGSLLKENEESLNNVLKFNELKKEINEKYMLLEATKQVKSNQCMGTIHGITSVLPK